MITSPDFSTTTVGVADGYGALSVADIKLPNAVAAQKYQTNQIGKQLVAYNKRCNSCLNHVGDVLRNGGVNVPTGAVSEFKFIRTLFDNQ